MVATAATQGGPLLSKKQKSALKHSNAFLNFADGAVRSGKTHTWLLRFSKYCVEAPPGDLLVMGKNERTIKRNVIYPLEEQLEEGTVKYVQGAGELHVFGRRCFVIGANDEGALSRVQGLTAAGGYMNETTLYPESVFDMAISRSLTIRGAQWFGDMNPDSPYHWMMQKYLGAGHPLAYLKRFRFTLDDNPALPPENVEMLKTLYGPGTLFYRRYIDGEWVLAEGAIYDMLDTEGPQVLDVVPPPYAYEAVWVGVDHATATTAAFVKLGLYRGRFYVFDEYTWDAVKEGYQKVNADLAQDFIEWLRPHYPEYVEVDPEAAGFKLELRRAGVPNVRGADNDVVPGIQRVQSALVLARNDREGALYISRRCKDTLGSMSTYVWDPKKQLLGEDKPIKRNDHHADAVRYSAARALKGPALIIAAKPAGA